MNKFWVTLKTRRFAGQSYQIMSSEAGVPGTNSSKNSDAPDSSGWSAALYNKAASFVYSPTFTAPILELLAPQPGEQIIDFGCGSGEVTLEIEKIVKQREGGVVVGVDFSESMVSWSAV